ncbi:MAG: UPF0175 family protein [Chloroflexia bacterium]|nr:UPF0175 family protein [Chloroflexia bacterium]
MLVGHKKDSFRGGGTKTLARDILVARMMTIEGYEVPMSEPLETISVAIPRSLLFETGVSREAASGLLLRGFIVSLYRRDRISSGKAAELLGIERLDFIRLLAEEKTPYLDYSIPELEAEIETLAQWTPNQ